LPDYTTPVPDEFLAELERLSASDRLALSLAFRDFLAQTVAKQTAHDTLPKASNDAPSWEALKPSRIDVVAEGAAFWTSVDLVDVDMWGATIRSSLEGFGIKVNRFPVGRAQHLVNVLSGKEATAPYVLLSLHGERGKLLLPSLAEEVAATERFNDALTPEDLHTFVDLPGRVVISLGCETGTLNLARAFLDHGCNAYIGPEGAPFGHASVFVPIFLFYELTEGRSLHEAVERLCRHDQELAMWRLFQ
jgi:hypothetical protein